tara:strand:- start:86 stop:529 length:444 start_codon:yes stop_codon:yes gene_type:complete
MSEENITMTTNPEDIFDKKDAPPKPKRVLTEKQLEGLAKGRAKVKANKEAKLKLPTSAELKKEQRKEKKELTKTQLRQKKARDKMLENEKLETWENTKYDALSKMNCNLSYTTMEKYLNTLKPEDVLDSEKLNGKLMYMVSHLEKRK